MLDQEAQKQVAEEKRALRFVSARTRAVNRLVWLLKAASPQADRIKAQEDKVLKVSRGGWWCTCWLVVGASSH